MFEVNLSVSVAFVAGLATFLSPCVLPIVPATLAFVTGFSVEELREGSARTSRRAALLHASLFVLGFSAIFLALAVSASSLGVALGAHLSSLQRVGGALVALMGLHLAGLLPLGRVFNRERRLQMATRPMGALGSVIAGIAFGAGWTPCIGPVLATLLLRVSLEGSASAAMIFLGAYALGLGLPFLISSVALGWMWSFMRCVRPFLGLLQRTTGILIVLFGVLLAMGKIASVSLYLAGFGQLFTF